MAGAALLAAAIWTLLNPIQSTTTTSESTAVTATTATPAAPTTPTAAPSRTAPLQLTKRTKEISESRPDTLIAAVAALGIVLLATAGFPGLKFGLGGASAEVLARETADTTKVQVDRLQKQVDNLQRQLRVSVRTLLSEIRPEPPDDER